MKAQLVFAVWVAAYSASALACERDPILFLLPGESLQDAQTRAKGVDAAQRTKAAINREEKAWQQATKVYLGRVTLSTPNTRSTAVRPLKSLKGILPKSHRILSGIPPGGLCTDRGDGWGAFAEENQLVVVFEGLPISQDRPRGIDSLAAVDVRSMTVINALWAIGEDLSQ